MVKKLFLLSFVSAVVLSAPLWAAGEDDDNTPGPQVKRVHTAATSSNGYDSEASSGSSGFADAPNTENNESEEETLARLDREYEARHAAAHAAAVARDPQYKSPPPAPKRPQARTSILNRVRGARVLQFSPPPSSQGNSSERASN